MEFNDKDTKNKIILSHKAKFAYCLPGVAVVMAIAGGIFSIWLTILALSVAVYKFYEIQTYTLYMDDEGVWLESGLFEWQKGIRGVKWRDVDEATFYPGFISWAFQAYTVNVTHRHTKAIEISQSFMSEGIKTVEAINLKHQQLIEQGLLK